MFGLPAPKPPEFDIDEAPHIYESYWESEDDVLEIENHLVYEGNYSTILSFIL